MFIRYLLHKTAYTKKIQLNKYLHFNKANRVQMAGKWALVFTFRPYTIINWPAKVKISTYLMSKPSNWSIFKWTHLWVNTLNACYSCPCCCRLIKKQRCTEQLRWRQSGSAEGELLLSSVTRRWADNWRIIRDWGDKVSVTDGRSPVSDK